MGRGHSRKRRSKYDIKTAAAVICCIAAVLLLIFAIRKKGGERPETAGPTATEESSAAVQTSEAETKETAMNRTTEAETEEPEPEPSYYFDKSRRQREYYPDENAALREYEWNLPRVDEFGNPVFRQTDDSYPEYQMIRGVDISAEQGKIDWFNVREARCDFVIIRADERFAENYEGAYKLGLRIGAYFCSSASTAEEAEAEAEEFLDVIGGRQIDIFAAYVPENMDAEGPFGCETSELSFENADRKLNTEIAETFCRTLENSGVRPAIYSSMRYEAEMYDMSALAGRYEFWYSDFGGTPETPYPFSSWQYCLTGGITGINGPVHLDVYLHRPYVETDAEKKIYSYTQFYEEAYENTSWVNYRKVNEAWNGEWARIMAGGQEFMAFGCGICCLSNEVSTLTDKVIMPDEMYYSTKEHTSYYPESGRGAVSWDCMKSMCEYYGLSMKLRRKPSDFETFVSDVSGAASVIILASAHNDRRLWWYTDGHYVSIWEYDPASGTVFVADPSTQYNRLRVDLIDIYNALKTGSNYQYALIDR